MEHNGVKGSTRRLRGDEGAALVEMSIAGILLVFLLLGVVMFGFLMSFRQNMTQAAAEGVRAGAVASDPVIAGHDASDQAVRSFLTSGCGPSTSPGTWSAAGMTCTIEVPPGGCPSQPLRQCIAVTLTYAYASHPLLPDIPLVSSFFPSVIEARSVAEINQ
jgi:hypothetical protein